MPLAVFAEIDERDVLPPDELDCFARRKRPAAPRDFILVHPNPSVGRDRYVHHLGIRELQIVHHFHVFVDRFHLKARIETFLLADGGDGLALVVVRREHERFLRQLEQFVEDRIVLRARIAVLKIGSPGAADKQGVAGEDAVAH